MLIEQLRRANEIKQRIEDLQYLIGVKKAYTGMSGLPDERFNKDAMEDEVIKNAVLARITELEREFRLV